MATTFYNEDFYRPDHSLMPEQHGADPLDVLLLLEAEEDEAEMALDSIRDNDCQL